MAAAAPADYAEHLGAAIAAAARARGIGPRKAAHLAGLSPATVYRWIYGNNQSEGHRPELPALKSLLALAVALGTTPAALIEAAEQGLADD